MGDTAVAQRLAEAKSRGHSRNVARPFSRKSTTSRPGLCHGLDDQDATTNKFVMDRVRDSDGLVGVGADDPEDHIRKWLDTKGLRRG